MARAKFEIMVVGDSRLTDMDRRITNTIVKQNMKDINVTVRAYSGKNINGITDETIREFKTSKFDLLYFAGGVNDLSRKISWRHIEPDFDNVSTLTNHMSDLLKGAKDKLSVIALKVILCDLVGLSYKNYNINGQDFPQHQQTVNTSIININNRIDEINNQDLLTGVKWSFHIHKLRHGRRGHRYANNMSDGLHFTDDTKDKFA